MRGRGHTSMKNVESTKKRGGGKGIGWSAFGGFRVKEVDTDPFISSPQRTPPPPPPPPRSNINPEPKPKQTRYSRIEISHTTDQPRSDEFQVPEEDMTEFVYPPEDWVGLGGGWV